MFTVNNEYDSEDLIHFINKNHIRNRKGKWDESAETKIRKSLIFIFFFQEHIIFYGLDLNVFCAIQVLVDLDIQPERIVIVCDKKVGFFLGILDIS